MTKSGWTWLFGCCYRRGRTDGRRGGGCDGESRCKKLLSCIKYFLLNTSPVHNSSVSRHRLHILHLFLRDRDRDLMTVIIHLYGLIVVLTWLAKTGRMLSCTPRCSVSVSAEHRKSTFAIWKGQIKHIHATCHDRTLNHGCRDIWQTCDVPLVTPVAIDFTETLSQCWIRR